MFPSSCSTMKKKKRAMAIMITDSSKRSKIDSLEQEVLLHSPSPDVSSPATSGTSDHFPSSMCSTNLSNLESLDLKVK